MPAIEPDGTGGISTGINVTPLCDIFVVLLIILMMAHDEIQQKGPAVDLPQRMTPSPDPDHDDVTLTIGRDPAHVYLATGSGAATAFTTQDLPAALQDALGRSVRKEAMVRAAGEVPLERTVKVIGMAYKNGAKSVGIATPSASPPARS